MARVIKVARRMVIQRAENKAITPPKKSKRMALQQKIRVSQDAPRKINFFHMRRHRFELRLFFQNTQAIPFYITSLVPTTEGN